MNDVARPVSIAAVATISIASLLASLIACGPPRDVVPVTTDVRGEAPDAAPARGADDYVHVAKRSHSTIALAEARGMSNDEGARVTEKLADDLDSCATRLLQSNSLVQGAARVIIIVGANGDIAGLNVKLAPGDKVAQNALLCLVAPVKALTFPSVDAGGQRGLAIEATWGDR